MRKKNVAVMFSITPNLAFAVANSIVGIERHSPGLVDTYVIYHSGITEADMCALHRLTDKCKFVLFEYPRFLEKLEGEPAPSVIKGVKTYTYLHLLKIELFSLLSKYRHALFLDADILIQKDISGVLDYGPMGWKPTFLRTLNQCFTKKLPEFGGIGQEFTVPSGGVLFVSDEIANHEALTPQAYELIQKYGHAMGHGIDEIAFALTAYMNSIPVSLMPWEYNTMPFRINPKPDDAIILHAIGRHKYWNSRLYAALFPQWGENNGKWLAAGGTPYQGELVDEDVLSEDKHELVKLMAFHEQRRHWMALFPAMRTELHYPLVPHPDFSSGLTLHLPVLPKNVFYLLELKNQKVTISIQFRDKKMLKKKAYQDFVEYLHNRAAPLGYAARHTAYGRCLYGSVAKSDAIEELNALLDVTYAAIMKFYYQQNLCPGLDAYLRNIECFAREALSTTQDNEIG